MAYPQSSLEQIIDSERSMLLDAPARYGRHYAHALRATLYLHLCIVGIEADRAHMFGRLLSLMKKQHTLAFLSTLRLHRVQAMMNLRQALEAGASAAFAIAKPELCHFADTDPYGILDPSQELTKRRYNWLAANYPDGSKWIKKAKDNINGAAAHANIIRGDSTFRIVPGSDAIETPFFDIEDEYSVKIDLGQISVVAIMLMDLFYGVARDVARESRSVIEFRSDFGGTIQGLLAEDKTLGAEIAASDRVKAALLKRAQREQANTAPNPKS